MQSTNWATEHSDALREYLAKGMSYSEIADAINARFQSRLFPQCRDRSRQANGACRPRPAQGFAQALAHAAAESPTAAASQTAQTLCTRVHAAHADFRAHGHRQTALCRNRSAPSFAHRSRTRRLPLPLRRRRGGRSHHLLRSPAAPRLKLLRSAFSSDARPRHRIGTVRRPRLTPACGGGAPSSRWPP